MTRVALGGLGGGVTRSCDLSECESVTPISRVKVYPLHQVPEPPRQTETPPQPMGPRAPASRATRHFPMDDDPTVILNPAGAKTSTVFRRPRRPPPDGALLLGTPVGGATPRRTPGKLGSEGFLTPKGGGLYSLGSPYGVGDVGVGGGGGLLTGGRAAGRTPG